MDPLALLASAALAFAIGYAAQRGSICAVRGVAELIETRRPRLFLSFLRCAMWVTLISLPLIWLVPTRAHLADAYWLTLAIAGGAFLFGGGAALNGGCSFSTIIHLGAGDLSYAATLAGLLAGFALEGVLIGPMVAAGSTSPLATPSLAGAVLLLALLAWGAWELWRLRRRAAPGGWAPEKAAAVMGLCGGVLYALHGSWMYTVLFDRRGIGAHAAELTILLLLGCILAGAALAARRVDDWRPMLVWRDAASRLLAGTLMGFGAALVPGGNDVLVMHAFPAASPHALPAYLALLAGAAATLVARRLVRRIPPIPNEPPHASQ